MAGDLSPDGTGHYHVEGTYGGQPAYERHPAGYWLWYHDATDWRISTAPGESAPGYWTRTNPKLRISGTLNPDIVGDFQEDGTYNGETAYRNAGSTWWIWWDGGQYWHISTAKGSDGAAYWTSPDLDLVDDYAPGGTATGTATVALIAATETPGLYTPAGTYTGTATVTAV